eukprot:TRINITY_DN23554_c0_g1_i1.p1 TRINITY_DN23554_c0_g1~~TRINITY_DN23554_c0_g1_i1.p1  ORF type:complete len:140 (-),score=47.73 TRINITY_DN23554_c0_g1_i1:242-661(-)
MATGIAVNDDCVNEFNELKLRHSSRFVIYRISEDMSEVIVEHKAPPETSYDDFVAKLPQDDCRYAVYDFEYDAPDGSGKRNKILFIVWSPDTARIKSKMVYASTVSAVKRGLVGIAREVQATDASEIAHESLLDTVLRI